MSVSLMYEGRLKSPKLIAPILEELRDLSEEHGWECELVGPKDFALVYGPVVTARGIHLTLDSEAGMFARNISKDFASTTPVITGKPATPASWWSKSSS